MTVLCRQSLHVRRIRRQRSVVRAARGGRSATSRRAGPRLSVLRIVGVAGLLEVLVVDVLGLRGLLQSRLVRCAARQHALEIRVETAALRRRRGVGRPVARARATRLVLGRSRLLNLLRSRLLLLHGRSARLGGRSRLRGRRKDGLRRRWLLLIEGRNHLRPCHHGSKVHLMQVGNACSVHCWLLLLELRLLRLGL